MEAIETLMAEHQQILAAIGALEAYAGEALHGGGEPAELGRFVTFIREFADAHHHAKEEDLLFAAMVEAGFPRDTGPIGVMLHEHALGRAQVGVLAEVARAPAPWSAPDRERLHAAALGYASLLRAHIQKEDGILYPMAEARLPGPLRARVDEAAAAHDARQAAAGVLARLEALGAGLVARRGGGIPA
jgi:hemerythrin-like domain-containing protein